MRVIGPQRGLFLASLGTGLGCLVLLDAVFAPAALSPELDAAAAPLPAVSAAAPSAPAATGAGASAAAVRVTVPAAARVPTIVARFESEAKEPADESGIRALARAMIEEHDATVVLEGHSDTRGGEDFNQEISLARADYVKGRLVELGVSAERVETVGLGATRPLHSDVDAQASVNRRVEVRWK